MDSLKAPSLTSLVSGVSATDRGSSDSLLGSLNLDLDDIDDDLSIPPLNELPSLDAVMNEIDSDIDVGSINSSNLLGTDKKASYTPAFNDEKHLTGSILRHVIFQGVTAQLSSAAERIEAGYASSVCVSRMIAVGTSHGYILAFDNGQTLKWCCQEGQKKQQGAVSALSFNLDDTRLLAGFARGAILMINTVTGDVIRTLLDAISPNAGLLSIKWTSRPTLALSLDTGGCVWSLSFTRRMGIRGCDSRCLFSGARGEVCTFEPLLVNDEQHPFQNNYTLVALATLSKFFILMIRPRLKVIKYHMLTGPGDSLPLLSWQMVLIQSADASRSVDPVLATARGNSIYFHQLTYQNGRINVTFLRHISLGYNILSLHWLGSKNIACIERETEILHLIDVRTNRELESTDLSNLGIIYTSAQFKGIATGGNVSKALALAGTFSCYSTIVSNDYNSTLYILGKKSLHGISARSWSDRLSFLTARKQWAEAFELAIDGYKSTVDKPRRHVVTKERILQLFDDYLNGTNRCPELCLENAIKCLIEIDRHDLLWQELWDRLYSQEIFLNIITQHILNDSLSLISPTVSQALLDYWSKVSVEKLEAIILKLQWPCLDLHQALSLVKNLQLHKALMHLNTKALNDYAVSLVELIPLINEHNDFGDRTLGNNILVYISSCLAGRGYPSGDIPENMLSTVKHDIMRILTAQHSKNAADNELPYPYLRELLKFDTRETLNVLSLAFMEKEFSTELGFSQRQRIINILLEILSSDVTEDSQKFGILCSFMSQQITTQPIPDSGTYLTQIINYITNEDELPINSRQHIEKEQTFMNLLEANALSGRFTFEEMLDIAHRTKCYTVARFILEKLKRYDKIVECFVLSNNSHELFRYILEYKNCDERKIFQQILEHFKPLLAMNCERISKFVIEFYPICVSQFLDTISDSPELNYEFLQALITNGTVLLDQTEYDRYLCLLCEYNPGNVLEFLQNHTFSYDVEVALKLCKDNNLTSAMIYLYEKKEDYKKAFALAMESLKESPESTAESQALKVASLCVRISSHLTDTERESFWFALIEVVLCRNYLTPIIKQILHLSSSFVDLTKLVQLIMENGVEGSTKNFGDIKHILIGMLTNFEYESLLLRTTQNILGRDLHKKLSREKQSAEAGIYCKYLKCAICKQKLSHTVTTGSSNDRIIIFSICGHSIHNECFQKVDNNNSGSHSDLNTITCNECGLTIKESDSIYINKTTNWNLISKDDLTFDLKLKSPTRLGLL